MLGSGEFVMLLLRCCLLLMRWLLVLLLLLRPRGRTGARPMRASSPSVGANSIISSRRNVLLGCTECAVRALSEKVRGGCVHSLSSRQGRVWGGFGNSNLRPWREDTGVSNSVSKRIDFAWYPIHLIANRCPLPLLFSSGGARARTLKLKQNQAMALMRREKQI